jgi:hypothetical protein
MSIERVIKSQQTVIKSQQTVIKSQQTVIKSQQMVIKSQHTVIKSQSFSSIDTWYDIILVLSTMSSGSGTLVCAIGDVTTQRQQRVQ